MHFIADIFCTLIAVFFQSYNNMITCIFARRASTNITKSSEVC